MPTSRWTSRTADLPEFSVLAVRQNLESLTGVKLKPVIRKVEGTLALVGVINGKNGGSREEVMTALAKAGKKKTVTISRNRGLPTATNFEKTMIYLPKLEATGMTVKVGGGGGGGYQLVIS